MSPENDLKNWQIKLLTSCLTVINGNASQPFTISELTDDAGNHDGYSAYWRAGIWSVSLEIEQRTLVIHCNQLTNKPNQDLGKRFYVFGNSPGDRSTEWNTLYPTLQNVKQWFHVAVSTVDTFKYNIKNQIEDLTKNL